MNQPGPLIRFAGSPVGAMLILIAGAVILHGWWQNPPQFPWPVALVTLGVVFQTIGAVGKIYRYKRWRKGWDAIGQDKPPQKQEKKKIERSPAYRLVRGVIVCAALLMVLAFALKQFGILEDDYTPIVFYGALFALVGVLVSQAVALIRRRWLPHAAAAVKDSAAGPVPIAQALNVPGSAPSRNFAEKNIPQYALALLAPRTETEHRAGAAQDFVRYDTKPTAQQPERFYAPPEQRYTGQRQEETPAVLSWLRELKIPSGVPSWVWSVGAAVIIMAVLGGLAHLKQGASAKAQDNAGGVEQKPVEQQKIIHTWHGAPTWTDKNAGLMWTVSEDRGSENWSAAVDYCKALETAGFNNWALPSPEEIAQIWDTKAKRFRGKIASGNDMPAFWTSRTEGWAGGRGFDEAVVFDGGNWTNLPLSGKHFFVNTLCVRPLD